MDICVLMSTYNGMKYIGEQLDSIFSQKHNNSLCVYVRDDGSTDRTVEYLRQRREYSEGRLIVHKCHNKGASGSFLEAINNAPDADIYIFCDQDDVWSEGKVEAIQKAINNKTSDIPVLWASNYDAVDANLQFIDRNVIENPVKDSLTALFYNNIPGCVMAFNRKLMNNLRKMQITRIRMHDIMTLNIALLTGELIFDPKSYVLYRQHGDNAIGFKHKNIRPFKWIVEKTQLMINKEPYSISEYAEEALIRFKDNMDDDLKKEYQLIRDYNKGCYNRFRLLSRPYTRSKLNRTSISIRCKILLGLM